MSCQLIQLSFLNDLEAVKQKLFPHSEESKDSKTSNHFIDSWDWPVNDAREELERVSPRSRQKNEKSRWLQECIIAMSPATDTLVFGKQQNAVFLTGKRDITEHNELKYRISFEGKLKPEDGDEATSMLCLPLSSQKRSFQGGPDWTCIVVGFKSGHTRMYTEDGQLLLSQLLHEEPVLQLKCQTYTPPRFGGFSEQPDELTVVYQRSVVCVEGFGLFQTLRACRNQLARASAGGWTSVNPPPLSYKKWGQQDIRDVHDCEIAGTVTPSLFDQMLTESIRKTHGGSIRCSVSASSLLLAAGTDPYVGFYFAKEGSIQPLLSDVAIAVASRVKNFISENLLGMRARSAADENKQPPIEPATPVPLRFGVYDKHRLGTRIFLSPNKKLAAVTDGVGRIILFDVFRGIALRIWKGYRDPECGWIEAEDSLEDGVKGIPCRAQFFVIYAARWGILEIWCTHQGSRVAAFKVEKTGRLLYNNYTLMGLNNVLVKTVRPQVFQCCYLSPSGTLYSISAPFHRVLSERNSKRAHDRQLLMDLKSQLKEFGDNEEKLVAKVTKCLLEMKTATVQQQGLDCIISSKHVSVSVLFEVIKALEGKINSQDGGHQNYDSKQLVQSCKKISQLCNLYKVIVQCNNETNTTSECVIPSPPDPTILAADLLMSEEDINHLLAVVRMYEPLWIKHKKVSFENPHFSCLSEFLGCFDVGGGSLIKGDETTSFSISSKENIQPESLESLGNLLFSQALQTDVGHPMLKKALVSSGIKPQILITTLLKQWLSQTISSSHWQKWIYFHKLLHFVSSLADSNEVFSAPDVVPVWWQNLRFVLSDSCNILGAYVGAVITRSVAATFLRTSHSSDKPGESPLQTLDTDSSGIPKDTSMESVNLDNEVVILDDDESWEPVIVDLEHWLTLVKQLKDVFVLSSLLRCSIEKGDPMVKNISLNKLMTAGQGIITELVASWICDAELTPEQVICLAKADTSQTSLGAQSPRLQSGQLEEEGLLMTDISFKGPCLQFEEAQFIFSQVKKCYSRSLELDSLLVNCAWEHLVKWNKDHDATDHLRNAIDFISYVSSTILKNGVGLIIWKTFIQKRFEALVLLMEKVGKTPKDRLCRRDVEISDIHLESFVKFCSELLDLILEATVALDVEALPVLPNEDLWQGNEPQGPQPLVAHAIGQRPPNYSMVHHHQMLATIILIVIHYQLKSVKPLSLFESLGRKAFFQDLHTPFINFSSGSQTSSQSSARRQFLIRAVTSIVHNLPDIPSVWYGKLIDLTRSWAEDVDIIRRHYVCELYSGGCDTFAEEIMTSVQDKVVLGSQILLIAGQRLKHLIMGNSDTPVKIAHLSTNLSTWLQTLDANVLKCFNPPLKFTLTLIEHAINFLPDDHSEQKLALELLEAAQTIMAENQNS